MNIEERICQIMNKMEKLATKNFQDTCGEFPPKWEKPIDRKIIERFETDNSITLPEDYKRFITTVAGSGTQPFYGLYSPIGKLPSYEIKPTISDKFLYTIANPLDISKLSEEEYEKIFEAGEVNIEAGFIPLCQEGCGMLSILIVNTDDLETYGTVWFYDLDNDFGIFPIINPLNRKPMSFLDWLEYYIDKTLELDDDEYFSYGELTY